MDSVWEKGEVLYVRKTSYVLFVPFCWRFVFITSYRPSALTENKVSLLNWVAPAREV